MAVHDNKCSFTVSTTENGRVIIGLPAINGFKGIKGHNGAEKES